MKIPERLLEIECDERNWQKIDIYLKGEIELNNSDGLDDNFANSLDVFPCFNNLDAVKET